MKKVLLMLALVSLAGIAVAESTGADAAKPATNNSATVPGHPAVTANDHMVGKGKVLEVINTSMNSFLQISSGKETLWIVGDKIKVAKGATVKYADGIEMPNFHSKSLNRTFDMIVFVKKLEQIKK